MQGRQTIRDRLKRIFYMTDTGVFHASSRNLRDEGAPAGKHFVLRADPGVKTARDGREYVFDGLSLHRAVEKPKGKAAVKAAKRARRQARQATRARTAA